MTQSSLSPTGQYLNKIRKLRFKNTGCRTRQRDFNEKLLRSKTRKNISSVNLFGEKKHKIMITNAHIIQIAANFMYISEVFIRKRK